MIESIKNNFRNKDVEITYNPKYSVGKCSIGKAPFSGVVEIVYIPKSVLLEFESFEEYLRDEFGTAEKTIEETAQEIFNQLENVLEPTYLQIKLKAFTTVHAPVEITIRSE